jgi:hypothetical protein
MPKEIDDGDIQDGMIFLFFFFLISVRSPFPPLSLYYAKCLKYPIA